MSSLPFEKSAEQIEQQISQLYNAEIDSSINIEEEINILSSKLDKYLEKIYSKLNPWDKVLIARHPNRPHTKDYIESLITNFQILRGDRSFYEDASMLCGIGKFKNTRVMVIGNEKGSTLDSRIESNFGVAKPEGYRKARRLMSMAEHFSLPIIVFVDTAGADPGIESEKRGQSQAIASCLETCVAVRVPTISIIIGEGGSGGAIATCASDHVLMLENSIYTLISPEGCSSILWRDSKHKEVAAQMLKITAQDLLKLNLIDEIIPEPAGGAHRHPKTVISNCGAVIEKNLKILTSLDINEVLNKRFEKYTNNYS